MSVSGHQFQIRPPNDSDLDAKIKKGVERISENLHISANEPSLALYRLQEHVRRAAPPTVARRHHVSQLHTQLQGACYDVEYAVGAVHNIKDASPVLTSMNELLKEAIYYRQQLKYEHTRRRKQTPSMYKRLSSHLTSIDLPDINDALRETASRMENVIHHARNTYDVTGKTVTESNGHVTTVNQTVAGSCATVVTESEKTGGRLEERNTETKVENDKASKEVAVTSDTVSCKESHDTNSDNGEDEKSQQTEVSDVVKTVEQVISDIKDAEDELDSLM